MSESFSLVSLSSEKAYIKKYEKSLIQIHVCAHVEKLVKKSVKIKGNNEFGFWRCKALEVNSWSTSTE